MAGTKAGGLKAKQTNILKHGEDFYRRIGQKGSKNGTTGGFASEKVGEDGLTGRQRAVLVGAIGGLKSRRGPVKQNLEEAVTMARSEV